MYEYTDGGLRGVWLASGYTVKQTPYGEAVAIEDQAGLTKAICMALTSKPGKLTGGELRYLRSAGFLVAQHSLAHMLGVDAQSIARWEKSGRVPLTADKFVRVLYQAHANGHETVNAVVERVKAVDHVMHQKIIAQASSKGWETVTEPCDTEALA